MLPTIPDLERRRERANLDRIHDMARGMSPFVREVRAHIQHEGRGAALTRSSGETEDIDIHEVGASLVVRAGRLREYDNSALDRMLEDAALQLARGMDAMTRKVMDEVTERTGNVVDVEGGPMTEARFLDAIELMDHNFDRAGNWRPPTVIGPAGALESLLTSGESRDGGKRLEAILERKRDEFRRREAARILVG
jgi:hypothetical protein